MGGYVAARHWRSRRRLRRAWHGPTGSGEPSRLGGVTDFVYNPTRTRRSRRTRTRRRSELFPLQTVIVNALSLLRAPPPCDARALTRPARRQSRAKGPTTMPTRLP